MVAIKANDLQTNLKKICELIIGGETVILSRPKNENVVLLSEAEYNNLAKARRNAEYLTKLARAQEDIAQGRLVTKTFDELREMEIPQ